MHVKMEILYPTCAVDRVDTAQKNIIRLSTDDTSDLVVDRDNTTVDGLGRQQGLHVWYTTGMSSYYFLRLYQSNSYI